MKIMMPTTMWLTCFLAICWLSTASAEPGLLSRIGEILQNEVQSLSDPIVKAVATVGSGGLCETVKKFLNVDYDAYQDGEPDLSKLTLDFISRAVNISYNLSDAAKMIPESEWFNPNKSLKIYFHGFTDDPTKSGFNNVSTAFLMHGDFNILALDASSLIRWLYLRSSTMVHYIGDAVGEVLVAMVKAGLDPSDIHLIGHSLGSHISGFAGQTFLNLTGSLVGRISGLDPAGPCFDVNDTLRLSTGDAAFVDVIHTDTGVFGIKERIGHVDFYPNSGSEQPKCLLQTCSHSRVVRLFAESVINPQALVGVSCTNWASFRNGTCDYNDTSVMGFGCPVNTTGKYYLQTNGAVPFGRFENGTQYDNNAGIVTNLAYFIRKLFGGGY